MLLLFGMILEVECVDFGFDRGVCGGYNRRATRGEADRAQGDI